MSEQAAAKKLAVEVRDYWRNGRAGISLFYEIVLCGGLYFLYRYARTLTGTDLGRAVTNAADVIAFETRLGLPIEDNLQALVINYPTLVKLLNYYYVGFHFPVAIGVMLWLYWYRPDNYRPIRNLMAAVTFVALAVHVLYPLAPPRLLSGLGFVDTMRVFGPNIYPIAIVEGAANQLAAMPSLHFGWALIAAMALIWSLTSRWRWLTLLHPLLMMITIMATGNHWWMDAAAAVVIIVAVTGAMALWRQRGDELDTRR